MKKIRKQVTVKIKSVDEKQRTIDFVLTKQVPDRYGDIVYVKGMDKSNFMENPVMPWAHEYKNFPIAKWIKIWVEKDEVLGRAQFAGIEQLHEKAETAFRLYRDGYLNAVSIGFRPIRKEFNEKTNGFHFYEWELFEASGVVVPAHPKALKKAIKDGIADTEDEIRDFFEIRTLEEEGDGGNDEQSDEQKLEEAKKLVGNQHRIALQAVEEKLENLEGMENLLKSYRKNFVELKKLLEVEDEEDELKMITNTSQKAVALLNQRVPEKKTADNNQAIPAKQVQHEKKEEKSESVFTSESAKAIGESVAKLL